MPTPSENEAEDWGYHLNRTRYAQSCPSVPGWANPSQRDDWADRGLVVWDGNIRSATLISPTYARDLLRQMKERPELRSEGCTVGAPAYRIPLGAEESRRRKGTSDSPEGQPGTWVLSNPLELSGQRSQRLFDFLQAREGLIDELALSEKKEAKAAITRVLLLAYRHGTWEG